MWPFFNLFIIFFSFFEPIIANFWKKTSSFLFQYLKLIRIITRNIYEYICSLLLYGYGDWLSLSITSGVRSGITYVPYLGTETTWTVRKSEHPVNVIVFYFGGCIIGIIVIWQHNEVRQLQPSYVIKSLEKSVFI